jgi:hypothetical protein
MISVPPVILRHPRAQSPPPLVAALDAAGAFALSANPPALTHLARRARSRPLRPLSACRRPAAATSGGGPRQLTRAERDGSALLASAAPGGEARGPLGRAVLAFIGWAAPERGAALERALAAAAAQAPWLWELRTALAQLRAREGRRDAGGRAEAQRWAALWATRWAAVASPRETLRFAAA